MTPAELAAQLPQSSVFGGRDEAQFADLLGIATLHATRANEEILRQGDEGTSLVILLDGVVRVSMVTPNGREIILDYAEAGAVLGEIAVLDGQPRTASAIAMWPGRLLRLSRSAFEGFIERHPKVAMLLATGDPAITPRVSLSEGVLGYLVKPFVPEDVVRAVVVGVRWHFDEAPGA